MTDTIWIAVIAGASVAVPTILSTTLVPLVIEWFKSSTRQRERQEDRDALEAAAIKAEQVAEQAREAARLLAENTVKAEAATKSLTDKVDVVHTLVNSNLTIATQKLREARQDKLSLLVKYQPENTVAIDILNIEIAELDSVLADRLKQAHAVDALQTQQKK